MSDTFDHEADAWESLDWDFSDSGVDRYFGPYARRRAFKYCNYCGENNLHWAKTDRGWRLHDAGNVVHSCGKYHKRRINYDEFEKIPTDAGSSR